jgi:hypothetical protein
VLMKRNMIFRKKTIHLFSHVVLHFETRSLFLFWMFFLLAMVCSAQQAAEQLSVSKKNAHLLVTTKEKPVFLNSFTVWKLLRNGSREDVNELIIKLKDKKFNAISMMVLDLEMTDIGMNFYGDFAFEPDGKGLPDPLKPVLTFGNDPGIPAEYDFWDHLDYIIKKTEENGMYVVLHPAWGDWFSGSYNGIPNKYIIFNKANAYQYGYWLGERYRNSKNVIWMLGGDRSAVYNSETRDYRSVYTAMAEGITEGINGGFENRNKNADNSRILISFHPRKWAPNSSDWFHREKWLAFNSIQDTPYDQVVSVPNDYRLTPIKPTWLCEGRYEGAIADWGVRYQAWQTVLSGAFGHTYGSDIWKFPKDWRRYLELPGFGQMKYLYHVVREIWTDKQFLGRTPDQDLIIGEQGATIGDGNTRGDGDGGGTAGSKTNGSSDRITAMRGKDGSWAIVYTAGGRDIHLDLTKLKGILNAYWYNPATGGWWVNGTESETIRPFQRGIKTGKGDFSFDTPGNQGNGNDWVLILKK